jgi:acetyl esterase/lipase
MIGIGHALGNLSACDALARARLAARVALLAAAALLAGCADLFYATVGGVGSAPGVHEQRDIEFDAEHRLSLDVYSPGGAAAAPVVVFFYGGSWESGKRRWYKYVGDALARNGVAVVIPDYRKYPDVRFPAFMHDAARAVAWTREHAREFGGDPQRLFVMGHSAGGQIAALLATDASYLAGAGLRPRDLAGMIGLAGAYAFLPFVDDEGRIFGNDARGRFDSQPINFVDGDEPPMLLLQGEDDDEVPPHNAEAMAERAQAMDGTAVLKIYPGVGHSSILLALARGRASQVPTLHDIVAFVSAPPTVHVE